MKALLEYLYPRTCCVCSNSLKGTEASGLCWDCRSDSTLISPPLCDVCGVGIAGRVDHSFVCADCQEDPPAYTHARSLFHYEGGVREAIHALKYQRDFSVVPDLARLLIAGLHSHFDQPAALTLVAVPLHWKRRLHREFNQGTELIRGMRRLEPELKVWKGISRVKNTETQTHLTKAKRKENVRNAFRVRSNKHLPERVVLIDDVMTTGATLSSAAKALKKAGVKEVNTLTLARG